MASFGDWIRFYLGELKHRLFGLSPLRPSKRPKPANCEHCGKKLMGVKSFECNYCSHYFCEKHHLPEKHDCWGNPKAPKGGYRMRYSGGKAEYLGQE